MAWCLPREGKLACQGRRVLGACREREGGFITDVPVRKGRKTACLSGKEGRQRACQERKEDSVPVRKGRKKACLPGKEGRQRACQERKEDSVPVRKGRKTACLSGKEGSKAAYLPGNGGREWRAYPEREAGMPGEGEFRVPAGKGREVSTLACMSGKE